MLKVLLKSLFIRDNKDLTWFQVRIIINLGLQHMFLQFMTHIVTTMATKLEVLKIRCVKVTRNMIRLKVALSVLEKLDKVKAEIVRLSLHFVYRLANIYGRLAPLKEALVAAGKRGLVKAVNRFDFDWAVLFPKYAKF